MSRKALINKLSKDRCLTLHEWEQLISSFTDEDFEYARSMAQNVAVKQFGKAVYFRGIIEFTNICKNDCYYCGIRRSNKNIIRYRLTKADILEACAEGYSLGFKTFVLQGGEDSFWDDDALCDIVSTIKSLYPDCAVTLSIGERSKESYKRLFESGADRYLLRHEAISQELYEKIHPSGLLLQNRVQCLHDLKEIGYQVGCGFMVGVPLQTAADLALDMQFLSEFKPQMVGIGPFIPHSDTPFRDYPSGNTKLTLFLLSLCRIMLPRTLLPATTALGTASNDGRKQGVLSGCNVVMPNISPQIHREKYMLYDNKIGTLDTTLSALESLKAHMDEIGYTVLMHRGDYIEEEIV